MLHTLDITPEPHEAKRCAAAHKRLTQQPHKAAPRYSRKPGIAQSTPKHQMADARSPRKRGRDARRDDSPPRRRPPPKKQDKVDRKTECPFLLRVFCKRDGHNKIDDYSPTSVPNCEELQLYTWPDCTLRELTDLVKHALSDARRPRCRLSFAVVYPDKKGQTAMKEVGLIWSTNTARSAPEAERKTLRDLRFQTGDFIDCAIHFPKINGPGGQYVGPWGQLEPPESPGADASSPT